MAKEKAGAADGAGTGGKDKGPALPEDGGSAAAAAELPFSEMIARWLDDGDKLHERAHEPTEFSAEVDGHEGRVHAFIANARAQAHRHRRVLGGAALLVVIVSVVAFRRTNHSRAGDMVSVDSTPISVPATPVVAEPPPASPAPPAAAVIAPPAEVAPLAIAAPPAPEREAPPAPEVEEPPVPATAALAPAAPVAKAPPVIAAPASRPPEPKVAARDEAPAKSVPSSESPPTPAAPPPTTTVLATATAPAPAPATTPAVAAAARKSRPTETPASGPAPPLEACKAALMRQRSRDALSACSQVFGGDPRSADNMVLLARADLLAGRTSETMTLARRAVATNPRQADAYLLIGTIAQTTGQRQEARSAYETYLQLSPYGAHASDVKAILRTL